MPSLSETLWNYLQPRPGSATDELRNQLASLLTGWSSKTSTPGTPKHNANVWLEEAARNIDNTMGGPERNRLRAVGPHDPTLDAQDRESLNQKMLNFVLNLGPGIMAGVGAKTADLAKRGIADQMLKGGADPAQVWKETGWGIGPDGKWRFEIPDNLSYIEHPANAPSGYDVIVHDELQSAYPDAWKSLQQSIRTGDVQKGRYSYNTIEAQGPTPASKKSAAIHELSHMVQGRERFSRGGSPDMFPSDESLNQAKVLSTLYERGETPSSAFKWVKDTLGWQPDIYTMDLSMKPFSELHAMPDQMTAYRRLGGEAEARLAQHRINLTPEERAAQYPWEPAYFEKATGVKLADLLNRFDNTGPSNLTVWHGSPHDIQPKPGGKYPEFDMSKIGTGEGAQAYGHGLYTAEARGVGAEYKDRLSRGLPSEIISNGRRLTFGDAATEAFGKSASDALIASGAHMKPDAWVMVSDALRAKGIKDATPTHGYLYKVDIPDEAIPRMLDWDKPLSQQTLEVQAFANSEEGLKLFNTGRRLAGLRPLDKIPEWMTGQQLAASAGLTEGGSSALSSMGSRTLAENGIFGIRYLDGGSRSAGQGTSNYVLFDDKLGRILEKNGVPTGQTPWTPEEWAAYLSGGGK